MSSEIKVDTISENTSANGVAIDSLGIKDGKITNLMNSTLSAADLGGGVHIKASDSGASANASHDELVIENSGNSGISILSGTSSAGAICFGDSDNNCIAYINASHANNTLEFASNNAERMRIGSNGNIGIGTTDTTPAFGVTIADTRVTSGVCLDVHHSKSDTTFSGMVARFQSARNTTNETYEFIRAGISGIANKFVVHDSGDVDNANNSYGGISDERVKQDIVDSNSQWNDIKSLKVKNFRKKANVRDFGDDALTEIGVIAQDLEASGMNGLVKECQPDPSHVYSDSSFGTVWTEDDDEVKNGTETLGEVKEVKAKVKTVKYSVLYMKAIKALQEAMTRIETLEAEVTILKGE